MNIMEIHCTIKLPRAPLKGNLIIYVSAGEGILSFVSMEFLAATFNFK